MFVVSTLASRRFVHKDEDDDLDYSNLMDRFRGRLVVPIWDATGKHVLGFGGRILKPPVNKTMSAPKYLNSPESPIFQKKQIVFGHHVAKDAMLSGRGGGGGSAPLVIVEGYMDVIALWQAGITNVVASMGTALTPEQLAIAAKLAGVRGGRIILCLDSDTAGVNAVERLCSASILTNIVKQYVVEIRVATLPNGKKDPAEFIESYRQAATATSAATLGSKSSVAGDDFRKQVLDPSLEWTDWYIQLILSRYDATAIRGAPNSFGDIFERVATFLSTFSNPGDRTKRACEVAQVLGDIMARETNKTKVSNTALIQLESDLVDRASRIANSKNIIAQRLESLDGGSEAQIHAKMTQLTRGEGLSGSEEIEKLSKEGRKKLSTYKPKLSPSPPKQLVPKNRPAIVREENPAPYKAEGRGQRRSFQRRNTVQNNAPLTPHFTGVAVNDEFDARWMGLPKDKVSVLIW